MENNKNLDQEAQEKTKKKKIKIRKKVNSENGTTKIEEEKKELFASSETKKIDNKNTSNTDSEQKVESSEISRKNETLKTEKEEKEESSNSSDEETSGANSEISDVDFIENEKDIGNFEDEPEESEEDTSNFRKIQNIFALDELISYSYEQLIDLAHKMGIDNINKSTKQDLIKTILRIHFNLGGKIIATGILDIKDNYGFLRFPHYSYFESSDDVYVSYQQIKLFNMKTGDTVTGIIDVPKNVGKDQYFKLNHIEKINNENPDNSKKRIPFESLIPIYPDEKLTLEFQPEKFATRILDLFAPIGGGQRALIVAPPKAGKTMLLQEIANAITLNHPDYHLIILLIDERPEEVTDMKINVLERDDVKNRKNVEVIASTFDEQPSRHVKIAEFVIEKAKRLVEYKKNVVILLDSITRLARAYNLTIKTSGKVLSGGVDASALYGPKKFFGAARNISGGGSLTIIATALVETGSKMDEVIFEEFKGTGNMEVILLRKLAEKRIFPAIDLVRSSTRKEELLLDEYTKSRIWILRSALSDMEETEAMEKVLQLMRKRKTNKELVDLLHEDINKVVI